MSHALCGVIVPSGTTLDEADALVEALMDPHREEWHERPTDGDGDYTGWWDWWQIGGRYVGRYSEYDPRQDPANWEVCRWCGGTGTRSDGLSGPGNCNGCCYGNSDGSLKGTGKALKGSTQWQPCPDDVVPVKVLVNNPSIGLPIRLVFPDGTATEEGPWSNPGTPERDAWDERVADLLRPYADQALVVVDYHC